MNIQESLIKASRELAENNIRTSHLDSELLLSKVLNKDKKYILLNSKENLSQKCLKTLIQVFLFEQNPTLILQLWLK